MSKEQDGKPATSDKAAKADKGPTVDKGFKVDRSDKGARVDKAAKRGRGKGVAPTAAEISAMRVVLAPVVSEKSTLMGEKNNQVAFRVTGDATKTQVRAAIEAFFKVDVAAVNMVNVKGKMRRSGRSSGRRQDVRKAYVTLAPGQEINFAESR